MFEVKTPLLKRAAEELIGVFDGIKAGTLDRGDADKIIRAGNGCTRVIETDLKVRLVLAKLNRIEGNQPPALAVAA